jgi:arylsulfatase A-like enzyme
MQDTRPNIVFIITDQQRYDTINAFGASHMVTPNMDKLVQEGVSFTNQFVTAPSCAPSRASLFTGLYPHTNGVYKNGDVWTKSWVQNLADSGYHCVNVGKMHTCPYETPLGFHERFVVENKDRYLEARYFYDRWDMALQTRGLTKPQRELYRKRADYRECLGAFEWYIDEAMHPDVFVGNTARWWIESKPLDKPFFLEVGFPGPHPPYDPLPRALDIYREMDFPLPSVSDEEIENQPYPLKILRDHNCEVDHDSIVWQKAPSAEQLHNLRAHYYANVTMIDEQIGEIVDALEKRGCLENTIIVFTSDHGDCLGDHGHIQKWTMFDQIVRTPLIVWAPALIKGGRSIDILCQQFDIVPALLNMAKVEPPEHMEACDLTPILQDRNMNPVREYVFSEQARDGNLTGTDLITMVRSRELKLVYYIDYPDDGELYDLANDPHEHRNLFRDSAYSDKRQELLRILLNWQLRSALESAEIKRNAVR